MAQKDVVKGMKISKISDLSFCEGCVEGKIHRNPFKAVGEIRSTKKLQLIHSDVCGPMRTESLGGHKYFVTFIDDYSRYCCVYFLKQKSEVFSKFKEFESTFTNESGLQIGKLRSDNGGEYLSSEFSDYLKKKGIRHELTVPYSPQQNGVAERMNRTLIESARSMLSHARLPNRYWGEAVATAAYLRNRIPTSALKKRNTPYEEWYERTPDVSHLRVFGCMAYAHVPESQRHKLDKKSLKFHFVGYSIQSKGYRLFDEETSTLVNRRDVIFNEEDFGELCEKIDLEVTEPSIVDESLESEDEFQETEDGPQETEDEPIPVDTQTDGNSNQPRLSSRSRKPPVRFGTDEFIDLAVQHSAYCVSQIEEPDSMKEALSSKYSKEWKAAADLEYESLIENETWDLVELPEGRTPIGSKWVFKVKYDSEGGVERFKGRLVAKGFAQKYGVDYQDTYAPVVRFSTIRTLLAFAIQHNMTIHQMDVVTAFLNGSLEEEIYMDQPEGYVQLGQEHLVCRLKKSLYGLKQSPRCWNTTFATFMESVGSRQSTADPCVYIQLEENTVVCIVAVYVDDLIIMTMSEKVMIEIKKVLTRRFRMKDMGPLHYCLGITIEQDRENNCIWMHQEQYILQMIKKFRMAEAKPVSTPTDCNVKLRKDDGVSKEVDRTMYQSMVGSLLYAANATRPDIAHAVSVASKFCAQPTQVHLTAVKRIFRYLKKTPKLAVKFQRQEDEASMLRGFSDADWAGDPDDRHSTSGIIFMMSGGPVTWMSKKQGMVTLSTAEAEYVALSFATQEAVWLRRLLKDLQMCVEKPTILMEDNQGAICIAKNPVYHNRTKHIDIRFHYIREAVQNEVIKLEYCPTNDMIADLLTKPLPKGQFEKLREAMGLSICQSSGSVDIRSGEVKPQMDELFPQDMNDEKKVVVKQQ
jgi:hypothetical protein